MSRLRALSSSGLALVAALAMAAAAPLAAQLDDGRPPLVERAYTLERCTAARAVEEVYPLLSPRGSVEVVDNGRRLIVRDTESLVERALARLAELDRADRSVRVMVQIVRADSRVEASGASPAALELPADVAERLHRLLRYRSYALLARAEIAAQEEVESSYEIGPEFRLSFRLDRGQQADRVRMREFRVLRKTTEGELKPLVHTHLSLEMGRPMILGLAPTEASRRALVLVLEARSEGAAMEARG